MGWRPRVEQPRNCLGYIHVMANGHALAGRKPAHEWNGVFNMRIAVTVNEWQAKDAHIDTLHPKKHFFGRKLA